MRCQEGAAACHNINRCRTPLIKGSRGVRALPSRLHQQGQIVDRDTTLVYVHFDHDSPLTALTALRVPAAATTFLGDSITDIQAAHAAHTMSIGYANKPGKPPNS